jgi:hypothetical protein
MIVKRLLSKSMVLGVVAIFAATFGAAPAGALSAGGALLTGSVTPDPVLTAAGNPGGTFTVSVAQTGNAVGLVGTAAASCTVTLNASDTTNLVLGSGSGGLTCNGSFVLGGTVSDSCSFSLLQVGGVIEGSGACSGTAPGALTTACGVEVVGTTLVSECAFVIN